MTQQLQTLIDNAWENRASLSPAAAPKVEPVAQAPAPAKAAPKAPVSAPAPAPARSAKAAVVDDQDWETF